MAEVNIAKETQKKLNAKKFRNSSTFAELMEYSKVEAAQYAIDCWVNTSIMWVSAEYYVKSAWILPEEKKEPEKEAVLKEESKEIEKDEWEVELSKEDLQELLKSNNIEFKKTMWQKRLLELAQENDLL